QVVMQVTGQQAVDDHRIGHVSEQAQVAESTLCFFDHHLLEVENDPHGRHGRVGEHLAHAVEVEQQTLEGGEHLIVRQWNVHQRLKHRTVHSHGSPLPRIDLVEPPCA